MALFRYLLILFMGLLPLMANAEPAIDFIKEKHFAGRVSQGIEVSHVFEFINNGNSVLIIEELVPS